MAKATTCDGTGTPIPDDTPATGLFGHQYSDEARPIAEEYLREVNDLHTTTAAAFQRTLEAIRDRYRAQLRSLPDEIS